MDTAAPENNWIDEMVNVMEEILREDLSQYREKADEYGNADLEVMGAAMEGLIKGDGVEAALSFYALGKISRAFGAMAKGEMPSDDTWHDLTVYSLMIRARRLIKKKNLHLVNEGSSEIAWGPVIDP